MKPKVIWFPAGIDACALFRMFIPHLKMSNSEFIFNFRGLYVERVKGCKVAVVQRLCSQDNLTAIHSLKNLGAKIVYDLDDDMWSVPSYNPAYWGFKKLISGFAICALECDVITVSTEHLKVAVKKQLGKRCPPIEVIENAIDFEWFAPVSKENKKDRDTVVMGWAGSDTHDEDVKEVFPIIPELLSELPELRMELVGVKELPKGWEGVADKVRIRKGVPVAEWASNWRSWQWDISLAPLVPNPFNKSKSGLKLLEAAALKTPCVATKIASYEKFCADSKLLKNTILVSGRNAWREKITTLVKSKELRSQVGQEMYEVAKRNHSIEKRIERWYEVFEGIL